MGATTFHTVAQGATCADAYDNAVRDALHWHGHGGYSGTIAEKSGFDVWIIPIDALTDVMPEGMNRTPNVLERISVACDWYLDRCYEWNGAQKRDPFADWEPSGWAWENLAHHDAKALVARMGTSRFVALCEKYRNKWGSAIALKLGDGEWGFFGYASC